MFTIGYEGISLEYLAASHGNYKFEFSRITVILGANGSGKSTLLRGVKDKFPSVYVEGGRTIQIPDVIGLNRNNFEQYKTLHQTESQHKNKRRGKLVDRIFDAIMVLVQREQMIKDAHSDAVQKWDMGGRNGEPPKRPQPPLDRLFEQYSEVFPNLHLSHNKGTNQVIVTKANVPQSYGPSGLSDGEKQVFSLMADMLELEDEYNLVVVDEPELNLHPELAERLWTILESEYQDKHFIYATHSIQFALRSIVDALYVISSEHGSIRKIERLSDIPRSELERFLGGVPGILNANTVVVTEGHDKSFDSIFYRWVLGDAKAEIFPCGNCNDVAQVIAKTGLWGQVSSDIKMVGVIDSDFRPPQQHIEPAKEDLIALPFHEAESFLCLPSVLVAAAAAVGSQDPLPAEKDILDVIFEYLANEQLSLALRRCFSESSFTARLTLDRSILRNVTTKEEALHHILMKSDEEIKKTEDAISISKFEERLDAELAEIKRSLAVRDIHYALKVLPGKQLLNILAPRAGCKNGIDLMRSIKRNLSADQFPEVQELMSAIRTKLSEYGQRG